MTNRAQIEEFYKKAKFGDFLGDMELCYPPTFKMFYVVTILGNIVASCRALCSLIVPVSYSCFARDCS